MQGCKSAVILPAKNEEKCIGAVIDEIYALPLGGFDIYVAEHGSTDNTVQVAREHGAFVIPCPDGGKGCQVRFALSELASDYDNLIMLDSDYTYPAIFIIPMMWELQHGADVVVGIRKLFHPNSMKFPRNLWNVFARTWVGVLYGRPIPDALTGMWAFKSSVIPSLHLASTDFQLEVDIWGGAVMAGLKIAEVPIKLRPRLGGETKANITDALPILTFALKKRLRNGH